MDVGRQGVFGFCSRIKFQFRQVIWPLLREFQYFLMLPKYLSDTNDPGQACVVRFFFQDCLKMRILQFAPLDDKSATEDMLPANHLLMLDEATQGNNATQGNKAMQQGNATQQRNKSSTLLGSFSSAPAAAAAAAVDSKPPSPGRGKTLLQKKSPLKNHGTELLAFLMIM